MNLYRSFIFTTLINHRCYLNKPNPNSWVGLWKNKINNNKLHGLDMSQNITIKIRTYNLQTKVLHSNPENIANAPILIQEFHLHQPTSPINQILVHALRLVEFFLKGGDDVTKCKNQDLNLFWKKKMNMELQESQIFYFCFSVDSMNLPIFVTMVCLLG